MRLIVGMTGATGAVYGIRLLQALRDIEDVETHLVISKWARTTLQLETEHAAADVAALADYSYAPGDQSAPISSGSFRVDGMIVVPASMKTVAEIRTGYSHGLIARAADVVLKERRKLVLCVRETPLSEIHLENMLALTRMGTVVMPPVPAFYNHPKTIEDLVDHTVGRLLDQFDLPFPGTRRWDGLPGNGRS
ncbi:non-oxidative hydroxyarylic acid decarboxylases subunit B [Glycomyces buryatensis]|uniref:Probable UbiX-like flavin prenyltransferase n=1 Tax=Glycomyces buryatensis TaxID=2570927 RepID=A0A4S8QG03_9ACTN|nr:non-oxidative hydroxyarylic acid decarboxylases subunit B [Glycomyces buryatensis]THV43358.1 UbiX family flavin prenyltransferase [Glycomyces buryatensis]